MRCLGLWLALACAASPASATPLPVYPVDANCREATGFFFKGSELSPARKALFEQQCVKLQQDAHDSAAAVWPALDAKDQQACLNLVRTNNYVLLQRCVSDLYAQEVGEKQLHPVPFRP